MTRATRASWRAPSRNRIAPLGRFFNGVSVQRQRLFSDAMAEQKKHEPSETEKILGRESGTPPDQVPPAELPAAQKQINPKWQKYYDKLLQLRDYLIDQRSDLDSKAVENQP